METGILHTHTLIASLYTLLVCVLSFFVITKNKNAFTTLRGKLRWPRMVLEILLLGTGAFLLYRAPDGLSADYLIKYGATAAAIAAAIIGFKRFHPLPTTLSVLLLVYVFYAARQHDWRLRSAETRSADVEVFKSMPPESMQAQGKALYEINCTRCHGDNGRAQYRKAPDLTRFEKGDDYARHLLVNGLNAMPAFPHLDEMQQEAVLSYLKSLKGEVQASR